VSDPLDLARRLRESGTATGGRPFDLRVIAPDTLFEAADLIERQHAENARLRAVEKAARDAMEEGTRYHQLHNGNCTMLVLRDALREKGAEK